MLVIRKKESILSRVSKCSSGKDETGGSGSGGGSSVFPILFKKREVEREVQERREGAVRYRVSSSNIIK